MSRATHADPAALVAACVMAACASWALEGASSSMLLEAAVEEAREAAQEVDTELGVLGIPGKAAHLPANGPGTSSCASVRYRVMTCPASPGSPVTVSGYRVIRWPPAGNRDAPPMQAEE